MIQMEFGEGSNTHQTISRLFDVNGSAIVQQATEYQMLAYLADDDEAMNLLHTCFLQPDFAPMRFSFVQPDPNDYDDYGYYLTNQDAIDHHMWHEFADDNAIIAAPAPDVIAIPPPPPANDDFAEIYRRNLEMMNADDEYDYIDNLERREDEPRRNIIQYMYNGSSDDDDDDDELPARG